MSLRVGSRGSSLARKQTALFCDAVRALSPELALELCTVVTSGDRKQGTPEAGFGDKKDWIAELETGLLSGELDVAIHSAKDVPIDIEPGTELIPVLRRANPFEALLLNSSLECAASNSLKCLPSGARVGTASLRRQAQIRWQRPDVEIVPVRGNVPTRVRKLSEEHLDGIVLAAAGLERLSLLSAQAVLLGPDEMLPAVNQGILVAQIRREDEARIELLKRICDPATRCVFDAERALIATIGADCHSAVGVFATLDGARLSLRAEVYAQEERRRIEASVVGNSSEALQLGERAGKSLILQGAKDIL